VDASRNLSQSRNRCFAAAQKLTLRKVVPGGLG
jgi:hypothetical protein